LEIERLLALGPHKKPPSRAVFCILANNFNYCELGIFNTFDFLLLEVLLSISRVSVYF
jgi:hypothetical protein